MEVNLIYKNIVQLIKLITSNESKFLMTTSLKDIDGLDSISYLKLIIVIEKHYKIKFSIFEINNFKNVKDICIAIHKNF